MFYVSFQFLFTLLSELTESLNKLLVKSEVYLQTLFVDPT
jgi:hypothetical protein